MSNLKNKEVRFDLPDEKDVIYSKNKKGSKIKENFVPLPRIPAPRFKDLGVDFSRGIDFGDGFKIDAGGINIGGSGGFGIDAGGLNIGGSGGFDLGKGGFNIGGSSGFDIGSGGFNIGGSSGFGIDAGGLGIGGSSGFNLGKGGLGIGGSSGFNIGSDGLGIGGSGGFNIGSDGLGIGGSGGFNIGSDGLEIGGTGGFAIGPDGMFAGGSDGLAIDSGGFSAGGDEYGLNIDGNGLSVGGEYGLEVGTSGFGLGGDEYGLNIGGDGLSLGGEYGLNVDGDGMTLGGDEYGLTVDKEGVGVGGDEYGVQVGKDGVTVAGQNVTTQEFWENCNFGEDVCKGLQIAMTVAGIPTGSYFPPPKAGAAEKIEKVYTVEESEADFKLKRIEATESVESEISSEIENKINEYKRRISICEEEPTLQRIISDIESEEEKKIVDMGPINSSCCPFDGYEAEEIDTARDNMLYIYFCQAEDESLDESTSPPTKDYYSTQSNLQEIVKEFNYFTLEIKQELKQIANDKYVEITAPVDCESKYLPCDENCISELDITVESKNGGKLCPVDSFIRCAPGQDKCKELPENRDCIRLPSGRCFFDSSDQKCKKENVVVDPGSGTGNICPSIGTDDDGNPIYEKEYVECEEGKDNCPILNCYGEWDKCSKDCLRTFSVYKSNKNGIDIDGNTVKTQCTDPEDSSKIIADGNQQACSAGQDWDKNEDGQFKKRSADGCAPNNDCIGYWSNCFEGEKRWITTVSAIGDGTCPNQGKTEECTVEETKDTSGDSDATDPTEDSTGDSNETLGTLEEAIIKAQVENTIQLATRKEIKRQKEEKESESSGFQLGWPSIILLILVLTAIYLFIKNQLGKKGKD